MQGPLTLIDVSVMVLLLSDEKLIATLGEGDMHANEAKYHLIVCVIFTGN